MPGYSSSKAALESFILCMRAQLQNTKVDVLHISPPVVQSELHDVGMGPEAGRKIGMPVDQFVEETWRGLKEGKKDVYVGSIGGSTKEQFMEIVDRRAEATDRLTELLLGVRKKHGL